MTKYADITPFYEWLDWLEKESNTPYAEYQTMMFYEIRDKLDTLEEVVRCKDCKMRIPESVCMLKHCTLTGIPVDDDDFCSYGERKDNG